MKQTVVIIDDDLNIIDLFADICAMQKLRVLGKGKNGLDAVNLVNKHKPDIVFMDVHMSEMSGDNALKEIKKRFPQTQVIMVTGDYSTKLQEILKENGATEIIFKPFKLETIINVIEKIRYLIQ